VGAGAVAESVLRRHLAGNLAVLTRQRVIKETLVLQGRLLRRGAGARNDPYRYFRNDSAAPHRDRGWAERNAGVKEGGGFVVRNEKVSAQPLSLYGQNGQKESGGRGVGVAGGCGRRCSTWNKKGVDKG
jgi:hypothetical protein